MVDPQVVRFTVSLIASAGLGFLAYGARVLDLLGSLLAFALAVLILQTVGWLYLLLLLAFVAFGVAVTRLFYAQKERMGVAEGKSGVRGWRNVAANGGVPGLIAAMTLLPFGFTLESITLGYVAAIATASADTFASELGVLSDKVYLITKPWQRVPRGTNGGVSNWGQVVALGGAAIAGLAGAFLLDVPLSKAWIPVVAGWIGCQIDSVLGALFEEEKGRAYGFLSKADVNFLSILLAAFGVLLMLQI